MALSKLKIPPGVARNGTPYQNSGRWYESNCVRWFEGAMRPIGGWQPLTEVTTAEEIETAGVPREMLAWKTLDNVPVLAIGTETALYAYAEGSLTDISPTGLLAGGPSALWRNYGEGLYGDGPYGRGTPLENPAVVPPGEWQLDTFGEILVGVLNSDGQIYKWDRDVDATAVPAIVVSTTLESCEGIVVTPERFLVALAANGYPRQIMWSSQEQIDAFDFDPGDPESTAGTFDLQGSGGILCGARGRNETLIWTESDLYAMRHQGAPLIFGVERLGTNCGPISKRAFSMIDGTAIWMGQSSFFLYDGYVKSLPSEIGDAVFRDINLGQVAKIRSWPVSQFGEVWFSYPSRVSQENDRVAVFNYREGHWAVHRIARTAGIDRGGIEVPIMASPTGYIYKHEVPGSHNMQDVDAASPLEVYAETAPIEIGDGERTMLVRQLIPDEKNIDGEGNATFQPNLGCVTLSATAALYPNFDRDPPDGSAEDVWEFGPFSIRQPTDCLISGRQIRLRISQTAPKEWRWGDLRIDVAPMGKR